MKQNFIRCSDKDTIEKLKQLGFQLVEEKNNVAVFINDVSKRVDFDKSKIAYSDIMTMS